MPILTLTLEAWPSLPFSPAKCFKGFASCTICGAGFCFGWLLYHTFLSYFFIKKSLTFCSSLDSGSGGWLESHSASQVLRHALNKIIRNLYVSSSKMTEKGIFSTPLAFNWFWVKYCKKGSLSLPRYTEKCSWPSGIWLQIFPWPWGIDNARSFRIT